MAERNEHDPVWSSVYVDSGVSCILFYCFENSSVPFVNPTTGICHVFALFWLTIVQSTNRPKSN
jgi:hypothetical protein